MVNLIVKLKGPTECENGPDYVCDKNNKNKLNH